ncbi:MAG TPA: glycosyltransferase family 4 protein [Alphaproteobacteria bacterium]|nr:glycosyltransferase family 4 protein [Alphaproteobacteria bacterium]
MKIWVVSQYYPPETGAPSARLSGLAKSWKEMGADVTVLTGTPNHPDGVVPESYRNRPAFYEETMDGVRVWRHWLLVAANKGKLRRVFNQLSFMFSVLFANLHGVAPAQRPDVVVASSPAFFCVISGWLLARRYGAKFVFEVRDLWPAIFVQMGILKPGLILSVLSLLEKFLYKRADAIVTVTRSFAAEISRRGIAAEKISVVFNGVSDADYLTAAQAKQNAGALRSKVGVGPLSKIVLYIGNHGEAQALGQIVDAARTLVRRTDIVFLFVGDGADKQRLVQYAKGVPNVQFLPSVKHSEVWQYYAGADINLVCLKNIPDFDMFIPSKMFEIMAAEAPAVAALRGEGAALMTESGSALVVPSEDADALAGAIEALADDPDRRRKMAASGRAYVGKYFLHSRLASQYLVLMKKLVGAA